MTKQDYIIIAKCLNEVYAPAKAIFDDQKNLGTVKEHESAIVIGTIWSILDKMFKEFPKDNPKFDWQKFKKAVYK